MARLVGKQAVRHTDLAIDRQWNREPAEALAEGAEMRELLSQPAIAALQAAIVQAVVQGFNEAQQQ